MPKRVQLVVRNSCGYADLGAVIVARPSKFANPFAARIPHGESFQPCETRALLVDQFRAWIAGESYNSVVDRLPLMDPEGRVWVSDPRVVRPPRLAEIRAELAGRDLACWCPLDQPCHGDVLLELANGGEQA